MATLTINGTIVRANQALAELMSCGPYDLVGVDYGRLTSGAGEQLDRMLGAIVAQGEGLTTFEHQLPALLGERATRTVRVTLAPIRDAKGQVLYVFAQVQDITAQRSAEDDLRRSEATFRLLVRAVGEYAIFMLDVDGNVISWNSGAQRIKGYGASEIVGRSFRVFYPPEEQATDHPERNLEVALREGQFAEEGWRVRKDGSRFWASVVISPVYDDAGGHIGFAKVTRDQTEQREHEEERRDSVAQQTHLLAVTAHELRTPTAVIDGAAGALRGSWDQMPATERDDLLAGIRGSAHRLRRLISDLATASRLHGETLQLRFDDVSLTETLRSAAARRQTADAHVRIEVDVPQDAVLDADAGRLGQALDNLLDNALRHGALPITHGRYGRSRQRSHSCHRRGARGPGRAGSAPVREVRHRRPRGRHGPRPLPRAGDRSRTRRAGASTTRQVRGTLPRSRSGSHVGNLTTLSIRGRAKPGSAPLRSHP